MKWIAVCGAVVLGFFATACHRSTDTGGAGVRKGAYQTEETPLGTIDAKAFSLVFSNDGSHLAYVIRSGQKQHVVVDGQGGDEYDGIAVGSLRFSSDGKRVAYVALKDDKFSVVVDGQIAAGVNYGDARMTGSATLCSAPTANVWHTRH